MSEELGLYGPGECGSGVLKSRRDVISVAQGKALGKD